jgi:hypothetical protein
MGCLNIYHSITISLSLYIVYMHIYICVYIYMPSYVYTYISVYMYVHNLFPHPCIYLCIHIYVYIHKYIQLSLSICRGKGYWFRTHPPWIPKPSHSQVPYIKWYSNLHVALHIFPCTLSHP